MEETHVIYPCDIPMYKGCNKYNIKIAKLPNLKGQVIHRSGINTLYCRMYLITTTLFKVSENYT